MSCSDPSCPMFVKTNTPYRTSAMKSEEEKVEEKAAPKPKKPFRIPKAFGFMGKMVLGSVLLTVIVVGIYAAYWVVFPGAFHLGVRVSDFLGWDITHSRNLNPQGHDAVFWIVGIGSAIVPVLGIWIAYCLGDWAYNTIPKKIK